MLTVEEYCRIRIGPRATGHGSLLCPPDRLKHYPEGWPRKSPSPKRVSRSRSKPEAPHAKNSPRTAASAVPASPRRQQN